MTATESLRRALERLLGYGIRPAELPDGLRAVVECGWLELSDET